MNRQKYSNHSQKIRPEKLPGPGIIIFIASWFGSGFMPFAPGTWGSLISLPFAAGAYSLGFPFSVIALIIILLFSIWISGRASRILNEEDPSLVVIDETAGIFTSLFLIPLSWSSIIAGFILFRFFDILKPFPVGLIDRRLKGGAGIVLDDVMAGIYANVCLRFFLFLIEHVPSLEVLHI